MKLLPDTHLLVWSAKEPERLSKTTLTLINDPANELFFSSVSIWEVAIKQGLKRTDFKVDARVLRQGLLSHGYQELVLTGDHAIAIRELPAIHHDPFDRILIAQARSENITLLTADAVIAKYPGPIRKV